MALKILGSKVLYRRFMRGLRLVGLLILVVVAIVHNVDLRLLAAIIGAKVGMI
ncbi:hypothetical protein [Amycolatopsis sp. NPDC049868]|uniref:hypothetical protein n=1 Tax=Amycolatopsis sp. NPDC049868 TaxID=3363934 RepID=UPI003794BB4F